MEENEFKENVNIKNIKLKKNALFVANIFLVFSIIFFISTLLTNVLFDMSLVDGPSMQPTINAQWSAENPTYMDTALYSTYWKIERGDIIIVKLPEPELKSVIKRLIAIGGDTIYILNFTIYLNDEPLEEAYLTNSQALNTYTQNNFYDFCEVNIGQSGYEYIEFSETLSTYVMTIPQNYIFFLGDNRPVSHDCSKIGPQPIVNCEGKVLAVAPYGQIMISYLWQQLWKSIF
jgi:signal peptidase I